MRHFADQLLEAVEQKRTPACVGFDPVLEHLPKALLDSCGDDPSAAFRAFGEALIEVVAPLVAVIKINIAFFEVYGGGGVDAYFDLVKAARSAGLLVIGDVKRGDIGHTSAAYAKAHLAGPNAPHAITINPYFGVDGVQPFLDVAKAEGRGLFVLVHTSNPSAAEVQHLPTDGGTVANRVARLVHGWGVTLRGASGASSVGAVVAPAEVSQAKALRSLMPDAVFLVPGFGAQGRSVQQVAACFRADGRGAIVNSSRGVMFAYNEARYRDTCGGNWRAAIEAACRQFIDDLKAIRPAGTR
jgi:orotidine-5'-phosphate decarboxylase